MSKISGIINRTEFYTKNPAKPKSFEYALMYIQVGENPTSKWRSKAEVCVEIIFRNLGLEDLVNDFVSKSESNSIENGRTVYHNAFKGLCFECEIEKKEEQEGRRPIYYPVIDSIDVCEEKKPFIFCDAGVRVMQKGNYNNSAPASIGSAIGAMPVASFIVRG